MAGVLLCGVAAVGQVFHRINSNITGVSNWELLLPSARPEVRATTIAPKDLFDPFSGRALNIAVLGTDSRAGDNGGIARDGDEYDGDFGRSDTAAIMHIAADRQRVDIVSIPRDTEVEIPSCLRSDGSESSAHDWIFNGAFADGAAHGSLGDGAACAVRLMEQITDIRIDGFIVVDFAGFINVVEAVGGVDVTVDKDYYDSNAGIQLQAGVNHLDGPTALAFARWRHGIGDGSDLGRIGRQQQLLIELFKEVKSHNLMTSVPQLLDVVEATTRTLTTSSEFDNAQSLAGLVFSLRSLPTSDLCLIMAPVGEGIRNPANWVALEDDAQLVFEAMATDQPLPLAELDLTCQTGF